jgi:hypothetical protein
MMNHRKKAYNSRRSCGATGADSADRLTYDANGAL